MKNRTNLLWVLGVSLTVGGTVSVLGGSTNVIFDQDFETSQSLAGWMDPWAASPPTASKCFVASEPGNYFLRTTAMNGGGVTVLLGEALAASSNIATIIVEGRTRESANGGSSLSRMWLTSRSPSAVNGEPFGASDSGIGVLGYQFPSAVDRLEWCTNGVLVTAPLSTAFIPSANVWHQWKVVFDVRAGTLAFYLTNAVSPTLSASGVRLGGAILQSLYLRGATPEADTVDYDNLKVSYTRADERSHITTLDQDFEASQSLSGWVDGYNNPPTASKCFATNEPNNYFLRTTALGGGGMAVPLNPAIVINRRVATIVFEGRTRESANGGTSLSRLWLTTRANPNPTDGEPYGPSDSGIGVLGYEFPSTADRLEWATNGVLATMPLATTAFVPGPNTWYHWRVVFDPTARTLTFYMAHATTPMLTATGVNLDGMTFRSFFVRGATPAIDTVDYDDLRAFYTELPCGSMVMVL